MALELTKSYNNILRFTVTKNNSYILLKIAKIKIFYIFFRFKHLNNTENVY